MTKLAQLIATQEGYYVPGTLPQRNKNPGDLTHAPGEKHAPGKPNAVGAFETDAEGWAALDRQLLLDSGKIVDTDPETGIAVPAHRMTLRDAIYSWAPPSENDTASYLDFVLNGFDGTVNADTPLSQVLEIQTWDGGLPITGVNYA